MNEIKLYREMMKFLKNQRELIQSFEFHSYDDIKKFTDYLLENIDLCKERIDKIVDGDDKE